MSNSCQNGGTDATGQLMVCALKDFKVWRFCSYKMSVQGYKMALVCQRVVSQLRNTLRNGGTAAKSKKFPLWFCTVCLQMAITSSFQIQITERLKHWTPDFLSFKMTYGMHNLSSRKFSKNVSNSSKMGAAATFPFSFAQSSSNGHNFFVSTSNRAPFEDMDS